MINIAIIGIGNIALLFDKDKDDFSKCLSHIKAIYTHKQFNLKYIVDIKETNINLTKTFFPNVEYFNTHKELINKKDIDILVIATPTKTHFEILKDFKTSTIKLFFIEKPLFYKFNEYINLDEKIKNKILINYTRRFNNKIQNLKKQIENNILINPQKIVINYCKGLQNNGSHMIDLLNFLFTNNSIDNINILSTNIGFDENDPSYDIYMTLTYNEQIVPIYFISHDHTKYNLIEFNIYFENKFVKYNNAKSQIEYFDIVNDENYPTYKVFNKKAKVIKLNNKKVMYDVYDYIYQFLNNNTKNISSFNNELNNITLIKKIKGS